MTEETFWIGPLRVFRKCSDDPIDLKDHSQSRRFAWDPFKMVLKSVNGYPCSIFYVQETYEDRQQVQAAPYLYGAPRLSHRPVVTLISQVEEMMPEYQNAENKDENAESGPAVDILGDGDTRDDPEEEK